MEVEDSQMTYFDYIYPQSQTLNTADFNEVRNPALRIVMLGTAILSTVALLLDYLFDFSSIQLPIWLIITVLLWTLHFTRVVRHTIRGLLLVILLQTIGIAEALISGPTSWEIILLCFVPLVATTLISLRIGAITLLSSFIAYSITIPLFPDLPEDKYVLLNQYGLSLGATFAATMLLGMFIFSRYNNAIRSAVAECAEIETALQNLEKIQERRIKSRSKLIQTSTAINQRLSNLLIEDMVIQALVEETQATSLYQDFLVYLLPANREIVTYLEPVAGFINGRTGKFNDTHRLMLSYEPVSQVLNDLKNVTIDQKSLLQNGLDGGDVTPHTLIQAGSALVPIYLSNEKLGFFLASKGDLGPLTNDDLFFVETLAAQTAISIRNARLFEKERRLARNEVIVQSLIEKIQKVDTIPEVLQMAAETLGTHLRSDVNIKLGLNEQSPFS